MKLLEQVVNHYLQLDPDGCSHLSQLSGKTIQIQITSLPSFYILPHVTGLHFQRHPPTTIDTIVSGPPFALLQLLKGAYPVPAAVSITGDMEVAHQFQKAMKEIDIDWEEQLSHLTGDVVAHQVGNLVRGVFGWGKNTAHSVCQTLSEYVQEEIRYFPPREEIKDFMNDVDETRNTVDRLEARIKRLESQIL